MLTPAGPGSQTRLVLDRQIELIQKHCRRMGADEETTRPLRVALMEADLSSSQQSLLRKHCPSVRRNFDRSALWAISAILGSITRKWVKKRARNGQKMGKKRVKMWF